MRANPLLGPLKGGGGEKTFWVKMELALLVAISGTKKAQFSGPTLSNGPCNGYCPHQNHSVARWPWPPPNNSNQAV